MITKCSFIYIIQLLRSVIGKLKILEEISFVDLCSCETSAFSTKANYISILLLIYVLSCINDTFDIYDRHWNL